MNFSLDDKHIIITYHYVEDLREDRKGIHPCPPSELKRQVSFLSTHFSFVSVEEVFAAAQQKSDTRLCALTFDDGLKDQYKYAVPILKEYNAPASFFIITGTLEGFVPATHIIHILLSFCSGLELVEKSNAFFKQGNASEDSTHIIPLSRRLNEKRSYFDDIPTANFKETIMRLPPVTKDRLLMHLLDGLSLDSIALAKQLFMDESEIEDLHRHGFSIGSHTDRHEPLDVSPKAALRSTIKASKERLEKMLGKSPSLFCYPYGSHSSIAIDTLAEEGFTHAVIAGERSILADDTRFLIPRIDTVYVRSYLDKKGIV